MSVVIEGLTKIYGKQKAIDNISFKAKKGEVLGFLGPNGAGKTTTMKIITCFIPQSEGIARVSGFDVQTHPMEVRARIGYLPEHNPLYKDLYVKEYLSFVAGMHKIKNKKSRVAEMIERTGLEREQNKIIGTLSKGYRQRVGLAQAMLHDPEVLILDEPTSGLDPNQLAEIRALVKQLGEEKTVIFSTHIMQEVQAICDRVLIINNGQLVANDTIATLQQRVSGETIITIELAESIQKEQLVKLPHINEIKAIGTNRWTISTAKNQDTRAKIFELVVANKWTLLEMKKEQFSVENVFQELTK